MKSTLTLLALFSASVTFAQKDTVLYAPDARGENTNASGLPVFAKFPGGANGWQQYLQNNLRTEVVNGKIAFRKRQKDSLQTVMVSFLVDTSGKITEVKVENPAKVTPAIGAEAARVIQEGPNWIPATDNGKKVKFRQMQSITFAITRG